MDGNSAKKVPTLDRLVDTPGNANKAPLTPKPQAQTKLAEPNLASTPTISQAKPIQTAKTTRQTTDTPKNRRTDKSKFEIELTQIINRIMNEHFRNASEEIVQEVLREVRSRLPGQRKV